MRRLIIFSAVLTLFSFACELFTSASNPNPVPATNIAALPTAMVSSPPAVSPPETGYLLEDERLINGYAIRFWRNPEDPIGFSSVLLIESAWQDSIRVDMASAINDLTGTDINADGYPDLVVETYSGGAHCCFGTQAFSLRPDGASLILQKPESNVGGTFEDLNADGVFEFMTYDDTFAYQYCPYASGVAVKVIMAYSPEQDRYLPASPRFPEQYEDEITTNEDRAQTISGELGEWEGTNICAVLPLALDYLYTGRPDKARTEFYNHYSGPDSDLKWEEILQIMQGSPLYTP